MYSGLRGLGSNGTDTLIQDNVMGLVKTRRLEAMHKQQRAKAGMKLPAKKGVALPPHLYKSGGRLARRFVVIQEKDEVKWY